MVAFPMQAIIKMLRIWAFWTISYSTVGGLFNSNPCESVCKD